MPKKFLSRRDYRILQMLANDVSYSRIAEFFNISNPALHATLHCIREMTGIKHTWSRSECREYLSAKADVPLALKKKGPTRIQLIIMRMVAEGKSYEQIACQLNMKPQSAQNIACMGCKRADIRNSGYQRTEAIRQWLLRHDWRNDPMF